MVSSRSGLRLFGLYAVLTLIPIALLGFVLARSFRSDLDARGLLDGDATARIVARGTVDPILTGDTLRDGPTVAERRALGTSFRSVITRGDALVMRLRDRAGHVVFDPDTPNRGPFGPPDNEVVHALRGEPERLLTRLNADEVDHGRALGAQAIEVYTPVASAAHPQRLLGALEIYVPYAPIAHSIDESYRDIVTILGIGLLALWSLLALVTWSVTQKIRKSAATSERLARTDALTGLANRPSLVGGLATMFARDPDGPVTIVKMDIDGFGAINESLGHENGDRFLQHVGRLVAACAGPDDIAARTGGDEFALALAHRDRHATKQLVEEIRRRLQEPFELNGISISAEVAIGRAERIPGESHLELVRRAAVTLRAAKTTKAPLLDYSPALEGFDAERLALVTELRAAIASDELVLHYQPKVRIDTGEIVGVEALVRWQHPVRGLLPPAAFLPATESTELIVDLTNWVLDEACRQAAAWDDEGHPTPIAVNVSARNLRDQHLADHLFAALSRHRVPTELISIEITETAVIADPARAAATLRRLADRGVRIAIDDFGVGYTSLSQLERLPIDELKIDREFVAELGHGVDTGAVVRAVVRLGHEIGMEVVAEGVEDDDVLAALAEIGCDIAQGYGIARPLPVAELDRWRRRYERAAITSSA
ncbi:MAG: putative bifunctional diguanylate cyclase/phosphodiesterase [Acidimicrobiia bacterium]